MAKGKDTNVNGSAGGGNGGPAEKQHVAKSQRKLMGVLVALLLVFGALAAAYTFFDGADLIADLMNGGDEVAETDIPPKPDVPADDDPASEEPTKTADEPASEEPTKTADEPAETPPTPAPSTGTDTGSAAVPPPGDAQARMYWEQVASQENIGKLVRGQIASFALGTPSNNGSTASIPVTAFYTDGGSLNGTMVLRNYNGTWYFSSITRAGGSGGAPSGVPADYGVVSTIVSQQATNQDIPKAIVSGGYKTMTVNSASGGSGTATLGITLSGGTAPRTSGSVVCITKTIGGKKYWFITSFAKR